MVKVSIITAIYNQEQYAGRCFDSLIQQTLKDIEIIIVDDGSTDSSLEIAKRYAQKDSRIIVLSQENAKQGAARNKGLDIAKGEFITFIDSDDWVELDYCELLYNAAIKYNVNIAASSTIRNYKHKIKNHLKLTEEKTYYDVNSIVEALKYNLITHSKLYRFEPVKNLRFEEDVLYEDGPYTLKAFNLEKSLVTVPDAKYHYYSNPTSTIKQKLDVKKENDKISTSLQRIRYAKEHNINLRDSLVIKQNYFLWAIKHYYDRKDFYLFGVKLFSKQIPYDNNRNFVIFNTHHADDVLFCGPLCRNIKDIFPESRIIFVVDKKFADTALRQKYIDETIVHDAAGKNKGLFGLFRFVKEFKYKNIYASVILHKNTRDCLISRFLKSRHVLAHKKNMNNKTVQEQYNSLIEPLTHKKIKNYPIQYNLPESAVKINVCLSCDENYAKYAGIVIASILANAKADDEIAFYILNNGISGEAREKILSLKSIKDCSINFVDVNENDFEDYKKIQTHSYITAAACYRLKPASILPGVNKIIYLDCDTIVCTSLRELFNIDLQDKVIGGVLDIDVKNKNNPNYVNSGVLLMDLDKIRACSVEEELLTYTKQNINNIKLGDQEIINNVLSDRILNIDDKYNVQSECFIRRSSFIKNPAIVHFIGIKKPWHQGSWSVHSDLFFKYLQLTPWRLKNRYMYVLKVVFLDKILSFCSWFKHRPFFYFQAKFWKAVESDFSAK